LHPAHGLWPLFLIHGAAHQPDLPAGFSSAQQQVLDAWGRLLRAVFVWDPMFASDLWQVFPQQFAGPWVQHPDETVVPLHLHFLSNSARRPAVVGRIDFHAAIQIDLALAMSVLAEGLDGQKE
jgi:hypothetical protein